MPSSNAYAEKTAIPSPAGRMAAAEYLESKITGQDVTNRLWQALTLDPRPETIDSFLVALPVKVADRTALKIRAAAGHRHEDLFDFNVQRDEEVPTRTSRSAHAAARTWAGRSNP